MTKIFSLLPLVLIVAGCASVPVAPGAASLDVSVSWTAKSGCSKISPPLVIKNLPADAKVIEVRMVDLNMPSFNHGGGDFQFAGSDVVAEGALKYFNGPCPPSQHSYKFTVKALNSDKSKIVGIGEVVKKYPE